MAELYYARKCFGHEYLSDNIINFEELLISILPLLNRERERGGGERERETERERERVLGQKGTCSPFPCGYVSKQKVKEREGSRRKVLPIVHSSAVTHAVFSVHFASPVCSSLCANLVALFEIKHIMKTG